MERTDFLDAGAHLGKQKVISMIFGLGMVKFSSLDLNIWCILKMSLWIKLIFFMLTVLP